MSKRAYPTSREAVARAFNAQSAKPAEAEVDESVRNAAADARTRSRFYRTLREPKYNEALWRYILANRDAVNRVLAASPRLREALAGRTVSDLHREGSLGEWWGTELLHAVEHPEEYGAKDRREVEAFLNVNREEVDDLLTLRDAKDLTAQAAARDAEEGRPDPADRAHARAIERIHREYGVDVESDEVTQRDAVMQAFDKHAAKEGPALLRDYETLAAAYRSGTLPRAQAAKAEHVLRRMETALNREAIRAGLRNGSVDLAKAQQFERIVNTQAMLNGELRPYPGNEAEQKTAMALRQEEERAAAARGELPEPPEHYMADADGVTPRGLTPEQRKYVQQNMWARTKGYGLTVGEEKAFKGKPREQVDLAYAEVIGSSNVERDLERDAQEREEREQRFAEGEATSRDHVERAFDQHVGTDRAALMHEDDRALAHAEEAARADALRTAFTNYTPAPEPEPAPQASSSDDSRRFVEAAYDRVAHDHQ